MIKDKVDKRKKTRNMTAARIASNNARNNKALSTHREPDGKERKQEKPKLLGESN
jgi:hypothetical protein